jgi:hypothetical protein
MGVLHAARALTPESGALDSTALLSALGDSPALPWLRERLALQTYRDNEDAEHALRMGLVHLASRQKELELATLREEITKARNRGDAERALELTKERIELERSASRLLRRER